MTEHPLAADLDLILRETQGVWAELRGQHLFITGGTGFVGSWLLESLLWANAKLGANVSATVLTRFPDAFRAATPHLATNPAIRLLEGDIRTFAFPPGEFPFVLHLATTNAAATFKNEDALRKFDTVFEGTRRAMEFAAACRAKNVLLASSGSVYGRQPAEMTHVSEAFTGGPDPMKAKSSLGVAKRAAEFVGGYCARTCGFDLKLPRLFAFVGPYLPLDIHYAIGNFIRDGIAGGPIVVNGDGTPERAYLYAADLVIWLWTIYLQGESCCPYNVGSEGRVSIGALAHLVAGRFDRPIEVRITGTPIPGAPLERYVPSTERVRGALGLRQITSLESAVDKTIAYATRS